MERRCTDAQWSYLVRLMNEAFSHLYKKTPNLDVHHMPYNYTTKQASTDIQSLLEAKKGGWK